MEVLHADLLPADREFRPWRKRGQAGVPFASPVYPLRIRRDGHEYIVRPLASANTGPSNSVITT